MEKKRNLSTEMSLACAMLSAGGSVQGALAVLQRWLIFKPVRGRLKPKPRLVFWHRLLVDTIEAAIPLGAPVLHLIQEMRPFVRQEERQIHKLDGLRAQFYFQMSVIIALPWILFGIHGASEDSKINAFILAGAATQVFGATIVVLLFFRLLRPKSTECDLLFLFLVRTWVQTSSSIPLPTAIARAAEMEDPKSLFAKKWSQWIRTSSQNSEMVVTEDFWGPKLPYSVDVATFLDTIVRSGAPARTALLSLLQQIEDERQAQLEERIGGLPSRISLVLCVCMGPALFLIFMGILWPKIQPLL